MRRERLLTILGGASVAAALAAAGWVHAQPTAPHADPSTPQPQSHSDYPPLAGAAPTAGPAAPTIVPPAETPPEESAPAPGSPDEPTADTSDKAGDNHDQDEAEQAAVDPDKRQRHGTAIIQALDKMSAETMRFEVPVGRPVRYKGLVFTVRSCETSAPSEALKDSAAYLEVRSEPQVQGEVRPSRQVFRGWTFASSPGVNPIENRLYDAWLIACKA